LSKDNIGVKMSIIMNRIKRTFENTNVDALLIMNSKIQDANFKYFTNFTSGVFENSYLIVKKDSMTLVTSPLEYEIAKESKPEEMKIINAKNKEETEKALRDELKNKKVGINENFISYLDYKNLKKNLGLELVDASNALSVARSIKDEEEIKNITIANKITKKALNEIQKYFKEGVTENQIAARLEFLFKEYGGEDLAFQTIVAFGSNSALPHHFSSSKKLTENNFVLIDCGTKYRNYCADVTRTFIFKPDKNSTKYKRMIEIYEVVEEAQKLGIKSIKEGVEANIPYDKVKEFIDTTHGNKFKDKFIHSLGHPVGLDVHDEGPGMGKTNVKLKKNMVLSVEPGIYITGFGGVRIEDDIIVTESGAKVIK